MTDLTDRLDEYEARVTRSRLGRSVWRETDDDLAAISKTVAALRAVLDVIGPHYATMLRRETKFGRTRSSCCCEQCRAVQAIADALGVEP